MSIELCILIEVISLLLFSNEMKFKKRVKRNKLQACCLSCLPLEVVQNVPVVTKYGDVINCLRALVLLHVKKEKTDAEETKYIMYCLFVMCRFMVPFHLSLCRSGCQRSR